MSQPLNRRGQRHCFLPDEFRQRKAQRRANTVCASLFLIVMAAIALAVAIGERSRLSTEAAHARAEKRYAAAVDKIAQVRRLQDQQRTMADQAAATVAIAQAVPRSFLVAEITNALPAGVTLARITIGTDGTNERLDAPPQPDLRVTGTADTDLLVAQFVNKLARSPVLKDVNLVTPADGVAGDGKTRRFIVEGTIDAANAAPTTGPAISTTAVELKPE